MHLLATRFRVERYVRPATPIGKGVWAHAVPHGAPAHEWCTREAAHAWCEHVLELDRTLRTLRPTEMRFVPMPIYRIVEIREFVDADVLHDAELGP